MRYKAQAAVEYLMMIAIAVVLIFLIVRRFFDPRFGTVKRTGDFQESIESKIASSLQSKMEEG